MRELTTKDKFWCWILMVLPILILVASCIPGIMQMFDWEARFRGLYVSCGLINMPEGSDMGSFRFPLLLGMTYLVISGILYFRNQNKSHLKMMAVVAFCCGVLFLIGLTLDGTHLHPLIKPLPYVVLPVGSFLLLVLAIIRLRQEIKQEAEALARLITH